MAPVAEELSGHYGVIEPWQTARTVKGQMDELAAAIEDAGEPPMVLIGHSWGAWLSILTAALHPGLVKGLILLGTAPLDERHSAGIGKTRYDRLDDTDQDVFMRLAASLEDPDTLEKNRLFSSLALLLLKADDYDAEVPDLSGIVVDYDIHEAVWREAREMRASGALKRVLGTVTCPIIAIHGDYDSHPAAAVSEELEQYAAFSRFILLKDCGHEPWRERRAKTRFYEILRSQLDLLLK
jgi:pimeloyl-ACP methyl ester carboxylesterase